MCKCIIAVLLADALTLSLLCAAFIKLNISDDNYNIVKLFEGNLYDNSNNIFIVLGLLIGIVIYALNIVIKTVYEFLCCCCCDDYDDESI